MNKRKMPHTVEYKKSVINRIGGMSPLPETIALILLFLLLIGANNGYW